MKDILESSEIFEAYARIDFSIYSIQMLLEEMDKVKPKSAIDAMIDKATGYGKEKYQELRSSVKQLLEGLLADFRLIEAEETETYTAFEKMLSIINERDHGDK